MSRYMRKQAAYTELVKLASATAVIRKYRRWEKMANGTSPEATGASEQTSGSSTDTSLSPPPLDDVQNSAPDASAAAPSGNTNGNPTQPQRTWGDWAKSTQGLSTMAGAGLGGLLGLASGGGVLGGVLGAGLGGGAGYGVSSFFGDKQQSDTAQYNPNEVWGMSYYPEVGKYGWQMTPGDWQVMRFANQMQAMSDGGAPSLPSVTGEVTTTTPYYNQLYVNGQPVSLSSQDILGGGQPVSLSLQDILGGDQQ